LSFENNSEISLLTVRELFFALARLERVFTVFCSLDSVVLSIGWGSIFLTHKVAGPIFKMGQYIRELQKGDLTVRIKFRKFDEIHHLAGEFNEMVSALEERVSKIKRLVRTSPNQSIPKELKEELEKFKTTSD